jgi:phosphate starvation-inducible protein PhoH
MAKKPGKLPRRVKSYPFVPESEPAEPNWKDVRDEDVRNRFPDLRRPNRPLTARHLEYLAAIRANVITMCVGPPGTGKTSLACGLAVEMLRAGSIKKSF